MILSSNTKGALLMALAASVFTMNDVITKTVGQSISVGQIMTIRGIVSALLIYLLARWMGTKIRFRVVTEPVVLLRTVLEVSSTVTFLLALPHIALAAAASIMQAVPLTVTLGAALFLRESVGWRRWLAIFIGFGGVILIVRPGTEDFTLPTVFVLLTMFLSAARDLMTRRISSEVPAITVTFITSGANALVGIGLSLPEAGFKPVSWEIAALLVLASVLVIIANQALVLAVRVAEVSFVAPFRYLGLFWAIVLGFLVFGEFPDALMLLGGAIVVVSGVYTLYREQRRGGHVMEESITATKQ